MTAAARCLRDLLVAKADGAEIPEEQLRVFRREEDLVRAALAEPRAIIQAGIHHAMLEAPDYQIAWQAIGAALRTHAGTGPLHEENVLAEMRRLDESRLAGTRGVNWMAAIKSQAAVDVGYALDVLVPETIAHHQLRVWNKRMQNLAQRIGQDPDVVALHQQWITESFRIAITPDGGRLGETLEQIKWDSRSPQTANLVPTGIPQIDRAAGGGHGRGELMVVGAGTNVGKSYMAQRLCRNQARLGRAALYVSVEDAKELFYCRMLADYASSARPVEIRDGSADPQVVDQAKADLAMEQQGRVYVFEAKKWTASQICALIRRHRYLADVDMVIVDYLQAIQPDEPAHNKTQEVAQITAQLKRTATDCGVALVVMSQFSREEYKDGAEPTITACKYAGDIENEAEIMALLWRDDDDTLHCKLPKIKWAKARELRYLIPTHDTTGCFGEWQEDFTPRVERQAKQGQGRRGGGGGGGT